MKQKLLLLQDVDALGKKGDVVNAKNGYIRNFLIPKKLAMIASPNALRKQELLRKERAEQGIVDRAESEELAKMIEPITLEIKVKVDPEGHMYGSVSASDVTHLFQEQGISIERKFVQLTKPIKETGIHKIALQLKEGVNVTFHLKIIPDGVVAKGIESVVAPIPMEEVKPPSGQGDVL